MSLTIIKKDNVLYCRFAGMMDSAACRLMDAELTPQLANFDAAADGARIEFDMEDVEYVASIFLRFCMQAAKKAGTGNFSVTRISPPVRKIFKIAGLGEYLPVV